MGRRAEQETKGITITVISRRRGDSMVRAAIIAGMAQAWPERSGRKLRPDSPNQPSGRWSMTAARAR